MKKEKKIIYYIFHKFTMAALGHHNALVQHIRRTLYQSKFC